MGANFSRVIHDALISEGHVSIKIYNMKIPKKLLLSNGLTLAAHFGLKLKSLALTNLRMKFLPPLPLEKFSSLNVLELAGDNLTDFPPIALNALPNLQILILSHNKFTKFPQSLLKIPSLCLLDISNNLIKNISDNIAESLTRLENFNLSKNRINDDGWAPLIKLPMLKTLNISYNEFTFLPMGLNQNTNLQTLIISGNDISNVNVISTLTQLEVLEMNRLRLDQTASSNTSTGSYHGNTLQQLSSLVNLKELDLSHNRISSLPSQLLLSLTNLVKLKLKCNKLAEIPKEISQAIFLKELHLQENQLLKIGKSISSCTSLQILYCEYNNISQLSTKLRSLKELALFTLHANKFKEIPDLFFNSTFLAHLRTVSLNFNPLSPDISKMVKEMGTLSYLAFMAQQIPEHSEAPSRHSHRPSISSMAYQYGTLRKNNVPALSQCSSGLEYLDPATSQPDPYNSNSLRNSGILPSSTKIPSLLRKTVSRKDGQLKFPSLQSFSRRNTKTSLLNPLGTFHKDNPSVDKSDNLSSPSSKLSKSNVVSTLSSRTISSSMHTKNSELNESMKELCYLPLPYSKFKAAFEALLAQHDFSAARLDEIHKAGTEHKYELLTIYKGKLVNLLHPSLLNQQRERDFDSWQKANKNVVAYNSPLYFTGVLKMVNAQMSDMCLLKGMLEHATLPWIYEFIDSGGINYLIDNMNLIIQKSDKHPTEVVCECEIISCLAILANISPWLIVNIRGTIRLALHCLISNQVSLIITALSFLSLSLAQETHIGDIIKHEMEKFSEFDLIIPRFAIFTNLFNTEKLAKNDYATRTRILIVISQICDSYPSLVDRHFVRQEFHKLDLQKHLDAMYSHENPDLECIINFEEASYADLEHVKSLAMADYRVLQRMKDMGGEFFEIQAGKGRSRPILEKSSLTFPISSTKPSLMHPIQDILSFQSDEDVLRIFVNDFGVSLILFNDTTTISDIINNLLARYNLSNPELYRIFFLSTSSENIDGFWVEDNNLLVKDVISKFKLGQCVGSFKMRPWKLSIECTLLMSYIKTELEPSWTVQQAIAYIVTSNNLSIHKQYYLSIANEKIVVPEIESDTLNRNENYTALIDSSDCSALESSISASDESEEFTPTNDFYQDNNPIYIPRLTTKFLNQTSFSDSNYNLNANSSLQANESSSSAIKTQTYDDSILQLDALDSVESRINEYFKDIVDDSTLNKLEKTYSDYSSSHAYSSQSSDISKLPLQSNGQSNGSRPSQSSDKTKSDTSTTPQDTLPKKPYIKPLDWSDSIFSDESDVFDASIDGTKTMDQKKVYRLDDTILLYELGQVTPFKIADVLNGTVHFLLSRKPRKVSVQFGKNKFNILLELHWTGKQILDSIEKRCQKIWSGPYEYGLMIKNNADDDPLVFLNSSMNSLQSRLTETRSNTKAKVDKVSESNWLLPSQRLLESKFDFKRQYLAVALVPRELFIMLPNGNEISIVIGFDEVVSKVIKIALSYLGQDYSDQLPDNVNFLLRRGSMLLSRRKTLGDVGAFPGDHLVLKQEELFDENLKCDQDIWEEPDDSNHIIYEDVGYTHMMKDSTMASTLSNNQQISSPGTPHPPNPQVSKEKKLIWAASLNKIVENLTDPKDYDKEFIDAFIFTYHSFATPDQLLSKLFQRYAVPESIVHDEKVRDMIQVRVCVFLTHWLDKEYLELDGRVIEKLNIWIENHVTSDRQALLLNVFNRARQRITPTYEVAHPIYKTINIHGRPVALLDLTAIEIAKQLTLNIWPVYSRIKPREFFDCAWIKPGLANPAPNVLKLIERFNLVSNWVATEICSEKAIRNRCLKYSKLVEVAYELKELYNFHLSYAVISGLNDIAITRLKWTLAKITKQTKQIMADLESMMRMEGSFKVYRDIMKGINNCSCIPYIGILLKDIIFIEEGNQNFINGLINWAKRRLFFGIVGDFLRHAIVPLRGISPIIINGLHIDDIIDNVPVLDENELYNQSLICEPKGAKYHDIS